MPVSDHDRSLVSPKLQHLLQYRVADALYTCVRHQLLSVLGYAPKESVTSRCGLTCDFGCAGNMSMAENTYQVVLRLDPDNSSSRKGLKRIKLMNSSKNAGNEAFKAGKWREAEQHYTQALEVDAHLKSSFVAQCACNRSALLFCRYTAVAEWCNPSAPC